MSIRKIQEQLQLDNEGLTPQQTSLLLSGIIEEKINFYKLQRWSMRVGDENSDTRWLDDKINELTTERDRLKNLLEETKAGRVNLTVASSIEAA